MSFNVFTEGYFEEKMVMQLKTMGFFLSGSVKNIVSV